MAKFNNPLSEVYTLAVNSARGLMMLQGINRPIIPRHVNTLADSLKLQGCTRPVVVAVCNIPDKGLIGKYILDGQHLFQALLRLGWPVPYIIVNVDSLEDLIARMALLNASSKSWKTEDYITAWSALVSDYLILKEGIARYGLAATSVATAYTLDTRSPALKAIKKGKFRVKEREKGDAVLASLVDIIPLLPRDSSLQRSFIEAFSKWYYGKSKIYEHHKYLRYIREKHSKLLQAHDPERALADVINGFNP